MFTFFEFCDEEAAPGVSWGRHERRGSFFACSGDKPAQNFVKTAIPVRFPETAEMRSCITVSFPYSFTINLFRKVNG